MTPTASGMSIGNDEKLDTDNNAGIADVLSNGGEVQTRRYRCPNEGNVPSSVDRRRRSIDRRSDDQANLLRETFGRIGYDLTDDLACVLLTRYGSVLGVLTAPRKALLEVIKLSNDQLELIEFLRGLTWQLAYQKLDLRVSLPATQELHEYLRLRYAFSNSQLLVCIYIDPSHRIILEEPVMAERPFDSSMSVSEISRRALSIDAAGVIVLRTTATHANQASADDSTLAQDLLRALDRVNVVLLDYLVLGTNGAFSLRETRQLIELNGHTQLRMN